MLLIRDPAEVVASYVRSREACEPEDIGLLQQVRLLDALGPARTPPRCIDAGDFLRDPEAHLRWLCDWLGIAFTDADAGLAGRVRAAATACGRRTGTTRCWRSTGFEPWRPREVTSAGTTRPSRRPAARRTTGWHALRLRL